MLEKQANAFLQRLGRCWNGVLSEATRWDHGRLAVVPLQCFSNIKKKASHLLSHTRIR